MYATGKFKFGLALILLTIILSACGPSPEELAATSAAETAAAATSTPTSTPVPTSTPTPTPVPYDLSVIVTGEEGSPVTEAKVLLAEISGRKTDEKGQAFWSNLPRETVSLSVSAQGYFPQEFEEVITRGVNQVEVSLERDPHGVLPSKACGPGEQLLYLEDFQDGEAQGWEGITYRAQGWDISPHPDSLGNIVLLNDGVPGAWDSLMGYKFDDAVLRLNFMPTGDKNATFAWLNNETPNEDGVEFSAYQIQFEPGWLGVFRTKWPKSNPTLLDMNFYPQKGIWHQLEMSTYEGRVELWVDGQRYLAYNDPDPLPGGTITINIFDSRNPETIYYIDNISVCELSAPFIPIPTIEP